VKCEQTRAQLTAYLDGELEGDRGSAVRGHLRECADCRQVAANEAALRDGLRGLPPIDPPASLWAGVQARLAEEDIAEAKKPAWRRALARPLAWLRPQPLSLAGAALAAVVVLLVWKSHRHEESPPAPVAVAPQVQHVEIQASAPPPAVVDNGDVTTDLATQAARQSDDYAQAAAELVKLADEARATWTDDRKHAFDTKVASLHAAIDKAAQGRARQQAYRALIRYLQGAVVRDEVAVR